MLRPHKKLRRIILRWAVLPIGAVVFILGAITFPLPLPTGIILMATGIAIVALNPIALRSFKRIRKRYPRVNVRIRRITPHMPSAIRRALKQTDSNTGAQ